MSRLLYLDTARLGQMSPTALKTHCDFVRLTAEDPSSLYTEQFLFDGSAASPDIALRFTDLALWPGIEGLKQQLRNAFAANTDSNTEVLLASRTTSLMQLSIRSLVANGRRKLLLTDLTWPPYRKWIQRFANRKGIKLSILPLRQRIWRLGFTADDVATVILDHARRIQADSLFLPAVTHTGIRLPLPTILKSTSSKLTHVHTIIDASQAYGHVNTSDWTHLADFTFGGCHKWVRAYLPLGVGFAREPQSLLCVKGNSADPLLQFCDSNRSGRGPMETVNLTPLLTVHGAVMDLMPSFKECHFASEALELQTHSKRCSAWPVLSRHHTLSSNIVLLQSASSHLRDLPNQQIREMLAHHGISATAYCDGVVRISVPHVTPSGLSNITNPLAARLSCLKHVQKPALLAFCGHGPECNTLAPIDSQRLTREL